MRWVLLKIRALTIRIWFNCRQCWSHVIMSIQPVSVFRFYSENRKSQFIQIGSRKCEKLPNSQHANLCIIATFHNSLPKMKNIASFECFYHRIIRWAHFLLLWNQTSIHWCQLYMAAESTGIRTYTWQMESTVRNIQTCFPIFGNNVSTSSHAENASFQDVA